MSRLSRNITLLIVFILLCLHVEAQSLAAREFRQQLIDKEDEVLIDIRSADDYKVSHLHEAINIDWNNESFERRVSQLDFSNPIYIYCQNGTMSEKAADKMRSLGFKKVYELRGGMVKWRAAKLPEQKGREKEYIGLTQYQFDKLLQADKLVLVDFTAPWCGPCKQIAPFVKAVQEEKADVLSVIEINTDDNEQLCASLQVYGIPALMLYKQGKLVWKKFGYISKNDLLLQVNSFL